MKSITLVGMSGVGKTTLSEKLPKEKWFHYSGDYRIGTYYLKDKIGDFLKAEAMQSKILFELLRAGSVNINANISISNLTAVSAYIGKLGNESLGGIDLDTFLSRQREHYKAEQLATMDIGYFKSKAKNIYKYDSFLYDAGGSICEMDEKTISYTASETDIIYIHADKSLTKTIVQRALDYPKPLYYTEEFLLKKLAEYKEQNEIANISEIKPNSFIKFVIPALMQHRENVYLKIAERYGKVVDADDVFRLRDEKDFLDLIKRS